MWILFYVICSVSDILTSITRTTLRATCTTLYTINVFFNSNGLRFFIICGPRDRQKNKYAPRIMKSGPGEFDSSHGFVRKSVKYEKIDVIL